MAYGRIHPEKGFHLAIEVAKKTGRKLIIAGFVQDKHYFEEEIAPHLDGKNIEYVGTVSVEGRDDLLKNAYAVLHLNTIPERFGLVMAESMAAGVPVIAMDLGSCREVIADGKTGFLSSPKDPEDLSGKIEIFLNDQKQAALLGKKGKECLKKKYAEENQLVELLKEISNAR